MEIEEKQYQEISWKKVDELRRALLIKKNEGPQISARAMNRRYKKLKQV